MTKCAIQGITGSYSEEAARELLGADAELIYCDDFKTVFNCIVTGGADNAVLPVENKILGEIESSMRLLRKGRYRVLERLPLRVMHVLAGTSDASLHNLKTVRSHIEALKQCRRFLALNSHLTQVIGADTASSIRRIVDGGIAENAAIGSRRAAEMYGAKIIAEDIADDHDNWTTFCLIEK